MREEIKANEVSMIESVATRERKLRPSIPLDDEQVKPNPAPEEPQADSKAVQPRREPSQRRRGQADSYDEVFLKRKDFKIRQSVYISQETHTAVGRLIHLLGMAGKEISVGGYIDNVVSEHMESHKDFFAEMRRQQLEQE